MQTFEKVDIKQNVERAFAYSIKGEIRQNVTLFDLH
jgi:hypothetical protein